MGPQPYEGQSGSLAGTQAGAHAKEARGSCLETRTFPTTEQGRKYRNLDSLSCLTSQVLVLSEPQGGENQKGRMASPVDMLFLNTYFPYLNSLFWRGEC